MTELEASGVGEAPPPYMIFLVVFSFFLTGLLGFLICHLLKKKGYRCRTGDMDDDEEEEEKLGGGADDEEEENQDTVEQILKCIIENEANMEAFNEMFANHNVCVRHDPRLRKESVAGVPPHHHTVHSGMDHNSCHLCAQVRSKKGRRHSRTPRFKQRPGEQTVFSVGRFRVTHTDKKPQGGPNPLAISGEQLDQSHDSEDRKQAGYNLRNMFKEVQPPSESANGATANVGKRRKSLTIFGLRRGSDPVGIRVKEEGTRRESGGVKFAIQQQPVVLEEPVQTENINTEHGTTPGSKPKTETPTNKSPASPQREAKTSGSVNSLSAQGEKQARDSGSGPDERAKLGPSPESGTKGMTAPSSTTASAPSSLPIPSKRTIDVEDKMLKTEGEDVPGPLQTSTPIAPMPGSIPPFAPVIPTGQPEFYSSTSFPVTQTPPDPSNSPNLEPGASLALISLGSSPPSSFPSKTFSSVSSLKSPTSSLVVTPSPKLSSRNMPSDTPKTAFSPALTPSPKLPPGREMSSRFPIVSSSFEQSATPLQAQSPSSALSASPKSDTIPVSPQTPSSSLADQNLSLKSSPLLALKSGRGSEGDMVSSSASPKEQELEGATIKKTDKKTESKRAGILKTAKLSGDSKGSALSSPSDQLLKDQLSSLPLPSPSLLSPSSSSQGSKISSVTIVKASPESKKEFSVVTMVEEEEPSTPKRAQKGESSEFRVEPEKVGLSPAVSQEGEVSVSGVGQTESWIRATSEGEGRPMVGQDKDDMVEMEDIRDCKVMQLAGAEGVDEEVEKMVQTQSKQD